MKKRPVNLDLSTMVFPPMAIASILHRISGVVLFLLLPWTFYLLDASLQDVSTFTDLQLWLANPYCKSLLWLLASASWYHVIAGTRHLLMDLGFGETLSSGRVSAVVVVVLGVVGAIVLGMWIW